MSHFCPIFAAGMKNSRVGNLLTRLKDTFIFELQEAKQTFATEDILPENNWSECGFWDVVWWGGWSAAGGLESGQVRVRGARSREPSGKNFWTFVIFTEMSLRKWGRNANHNLTFMTLMSEFEKSPNSICSLKTPSPNSLWPAGRALTPQLPSRLVQLIASHLQSPLLPGKNADYKSSEQIPELKLRQHDSQTGATHPADTLILVSLLRKRLQFTSGGSSHLAFQINCETVNSSHSAHSSRQQFSAIKAWCTRGGTGVEGGHPQVPISLPTHATERSSSIPAFAHSFNTVICFYHLVQT